MARQRKRRQGLCVCVGSSRLRPQVARVRALLPCCWCDKHLCWELRTTSWDGHMQRALLCAHCCSWPDVELCGVPPHYTLQRVYSKGQNVPIFMDLSKSPPWIYNIKRNVPDPVVKQPAYVRWLPQTPRSQTPRCPRA